ncbi:MAG: electron transfer flavoprotein, partial [Geminicoccaceae bacterium]
GYLAADEPSLRVYRVGDQAAVIPSFTGDGMAIALLSARFAAAALLTGEEAPEHHRRLASAVRRPLAWAGSIDTLAQGWCTRQLLLLACRVAPMLIGRMALRTRAAPVGL